jgi:UPF0755 protein
MNKRRILYIIAFIFFLVIIACLFIGREVWQWSRFLATPIIPANKELIYIIKPGATLSEVAHDLQNQGYLQDPNYLIWLADWRGYKTKLKAGEYQFKGGIRPWQLLQQIVTGKVMQHTVTFIEGWTFAQMQARLNVAPSLTHNTMNKPNDQIMSTLKATESNPEGLFYPDTYKYTYGTTDVDILKISYHLMQQKLQSIWPNRAPDLPYKTQYEALIVASLIEKEAKHPEDRPLIASVIVNRLQKNMPLQIDATVIYARGANYRVVIKAKDLKSESPYNTYKHKGLPPTPICMPSFASIQAALHPATTNNLYYVAKGDGKHIFSETLAEHHAAVKKYLRAFPKAAFDRSFITNNRRNNK